MNRAARTTRAATMLNFVKILAYLGAKYDPKPLRTPYSHPTYTVNARACHEICS